VIFNTHHAHPTGLEVDTFIMPTSTRVERSAGQGSLAGQDQPSKSLASPTVQSTTRAEKGKKKEREKGSGFVD
jgi:hypothetical protein